MVTRFHIVAASVAVGLSYLLISQTSALGKASNVDWPLYGNDLANTRFQDVDGITPENAGRLRPAWVFHTGVLDPDTSFEASPIVVAGIMYVTTGHDDVFALDAATGKTMWTYHPRLLAPIADLQACCGRVNRGVTYGNGKLYLARLDGVVDALDAATGKPVWERRVLDLGRRYTLTMAPQVAGGMVIVGASGGEYEVRGRVTAFDADTGDQKWVSFTTVPGQTWADSSWQYGGAPVWQTPAVDPQLGLVYVTTGNAAPDINGSLRAGANFFASSIIAFDLSTGVLKWAFQEVHHDLWDYDAAQPVVLFDIAGNGSRVPALGECGKNGNYYILDRRNGKPLFSIDEKSVPTTPTWQHPFPTQPVSSVEPLVPLRIIPGTIDRHKLPKNITLASQYTPPNDDHVLIQPGDDGVCEFPPAAYSPRTKFVYYGGRYEPAEYHTFPDDLGPDPKGLFLGSTFKELIPGVEDFGVFGATDTTTGKVIWRIKVAQPAKSGVLVAGDVFFFGEGNGKFHAVDARNGKVLFTFDGTSIPHGGGAQGAPTAYVVNGTEYIANAFGGNFADRQFAPNPVGDALVAFSVK